MALRQKVEKAFHEADTGKTGFITKARLKECLKILNLELTVGELETLFGKLEVIGDDVQIADFIDFLYPPLEDTRMKLTDAVMGPGDDEECRVPDCARDVLEAYGGMPAHAVDKAMSPFDGKWARSELEAHYGHFYIIKGDHVTYHSQAWKFADLGEGTCLIEEEGRGQTRGRTQTGKLASNGKSIKWSNETNPKARFGIVEYGAVWYCEQEVVTGKLYGDCDCGDHWGAPHRYPTCPKCGGPLPEHK